MAWVLAAQLGWVELRYLAVACLVCFVIAGLFVVGRSSVEVTLEVQPTRAFVGSPISGELVLRNAGRGRLLPLELDLPVGQATARFAVPSLASGAEHSELFVVPTSRRAVLAVGPASAVRTDPLSLLRREAVTPVSAEIYVHPAIRPLDPFAAGLLRDLEGRTTRDISTSDLAFHALREYVPGDDRRYVHWRSSAKAGKLLVRQFLDTRRSTLTVVVDGQPESWSTPEDLETGMSVAGSIVVRAVRDELDTTLVAAGEVVSAGGSRRYLDALSRAEPAAGMVLAAQVNRATRVAPDTSVAVLVTGDVVAYPQLRMAARSFGIDTNVLVVRVEPSAPPTLSSSHGMTVLALRTVDDLPILLRAGIAA